MKVSVFAPLFGNVGVEDAMTSLAGELVNLGDEVVMIRTAKEWSFLGSQPDSSVAMHRLAVQHIASRLPARGWLIYRITALITAVMTVIPLAFYLNRKKPDVLIAAMMPTTAVIAKWISRSDTRLIVSVQGFPRPGRLRRLTWKLMWKSSDALVTESNELGDLVAEQTEVQRDLITTIYNPHLNPEATALAARPATLADELPGAEFLVVAVGRLTRQKGFDTLIRAVKLVSDQLDANLLILGEGELRRELEQLARSLGVESRVSLPGHVDNPYPYMKRADVLAVSSRWEGLARVPIEAQSLGTPVVAPEISGGVQEILMYGEAGVIVEKDSPDALAAGIVSLLTDPGLCARLSATAKQHIGRFDPAETARLYKELIESLDKR